MQKRILVVDDDPSFNKMLSAFLGRHGFLVNSVYTSKSAMESMGNEMPDLVLTDFKLPDLDGLELIELIKSKSPEMAIILMTNYSDIRTAVKSIQLGAFEFVTKPVNPDELLITIQAALNQKEKKVAIAKPEKKRNITSSDKKYIIGQSAASKQLWEHIKLVAPTQMSVLLLGESGTGKEYAAKMIHESSKRADKTFIAVDCGALSKELAASELFGHVKGAFTGALKDKKGQFELAEGGTLFLDEVGNLPYDVQVQLLRALQERKIKRVGSETDISVDVRLISATNEKMQQAIDEQQFRLDLFHRLNEFELKLMPLRKRLGDLDEYLNFFLDQANSELEKTVSGFSSAVIQVFQQYSWPGNLRELRNIVRRAVLLCQTDLIELAQIPNTLMNENEVLEEKEHEKPIATKPESRGLLHNLKAMQELQEKETIEKVLLETKYNKSKAAELLNIDRSTLYNKIAKYNIEI
ncbi:chemotaxis protein CheY [Roseivirga seohaensis subsp. aquiponti]|uniref:Chemotaxis protein CheY n=1 Tax=Roseivirga seohaensis subsp. aquiponti TaxID=1566026 RepID=A0A0L8ANK4_9BACT|nr:sigma-54 dependent transcriptional regulator [Roseivirga seohaensis]KOF03752.1 chemotaxis protein CheY [Roseivirga seohaensis subsp. aquiponti]